MATTLLPAVSVELEMRLLKGFLAVMFISRTAGQTAQSQWAQDGIGRWMGNTVYSLRALDRLELYLRLTS